jgi:predicted transcriptional regulator
MPLKAVEIMREPIVVQEDDRLRDVARTMLHRQATCAAVVDAAGRLVGVIEDDAFCLTHRNFPFSTDKGVQLFGEWVTAPVIEQTYASVRERYARDVMARSPSTVPEEAHLAQFLPLLGQRRHVFVLRDGHPVGVVTRHDLLKMVAGPPE